jgi:hypothetical protein
VGIHDALGLTVVRLHVKVLEHVVLLAQYPGELRGVPDANAWGATRQEQADVEAGADDALGARPAHGVVGRQRRCDVRSRCHCPPQQPAQHEGLLHSHPGVGPLEGKKPVCRVADQARLLSRVGTCWNVLRLAYACDLDGIDALYKLERKKKRDC